MLDQLFAAGDTLAQDVGVVQRVIDAGHRCVDGYFVMKVQVECPFLGVGRDWRLAAGKFDRSQNVGLFLAERFVGKAFQCADEQAFHEKFPFDSECGPRWSRRRSWVSCAKMDRAISSGVTAPIARPAGA